MKKNELDHIDIQILNLLQVDARMSLKDLAAKVFLSAPAVSARIDALVRSGFITGFRAQVDPIALGYHIKAFVSLELEPVDKKEFYPYVKNCPNVVECNCVTGDYSMLLEVLFHSTVELDQFIGELQRFGRTRTMIVFSTSIEQRGVQLPD